MPTRNGPYQNRARIEWSWSVSAINQSTSSVTVTVTAYLRMQSGASIAGNWPVSWSGSWGNSSNTQGITLSGGQRQQIRRSSFTVSLTDSSQTRNVAISVNHFHGTTSNTLSISIGARYARTPTNLLVSRQSDNRINLSWSNTGTYTRVGVQMQADTGSGFSLGGSASASGNVTSYASTGRIPNRRYRYRVRGHTSGGASPWTGWSTIVYTTPATPSAPRAARSGNSIRVSLGSSTSLFGSHFDVWDDATGNIVGSNIPRGSFPWTHTNPDPEVRHRYRIRARRAQYSTGGTVLTSGWSSYSAWVELQSPPNAPTNLSPNGRSIGIDVATTFSWSHSPVDSSDQSEYELRYRIGSVGTWTTLSGTTASSRSITFEEAGAYQWQVRTRGSHPDWSPWSATATFTAVTAPSVAITQPSSEVWTVPTMTVQWEYAQPDDLPQSAWRVHLINVDGEDETVVEERNGTGSASSVNLNYRLERDTNYIVRVWVQAQGVWSEPDETSFLVAFTPPSPPVVEGEWDEEVGAVCLTVEDGRGPGRDDIVNVFPNPRFRTEGDGLNISRVNGHQNPGARYGSGVDTPGFSSQGATTFFPRAAVEVEWSDSGHAVEYWTSAESEAQTQIRYGATLEQLADVLGLSSMVGETVTIEWQWVRPTVGTTRSVQPPMHREVSTPIPYDSRGRSSVIVEPIAGNVYTDWITFTVTPLDSNFDTRNVSVVANGTSPDHRIQVSNVKMYLGEYDQTVEWFDGDSEATGDDPIYWYGEPGESVSIEATPTPKHFEAVSPARSVMSDEGALVTLVSAVGTIDLNLDLDLSEGARYTVLVEARLTSPLAEGEMAAFAPMLDSSGFEQLLLVESTEWQQFRLETFVGDSAGVSDQFVIVNTSATDPSIEFRNLAIIPADDPEPIPDGAVNLLLNPNMEATAGTRVEVRRNYCTNPSFEVDVERLTSIGSSVTVARSTFGNAIAVGSGALAITNSDSLISNAYVETDLAVPGEGWAAFSFVARKSSATSGPQDFRIYVRFEGSTETAWLTDPIPLTTAPNSEQERHSFAVQVPEGATRAIFRLRLQTGSQPASDGVTHTDAWVTGLGSTEAEALAQVSEYFDGSVSPDPDLEPRWSFLPHRSESTLEGQRVGNLQSGSQSWTLHPYQTQDGPVSGYFAARFVVTSAGAIGIPVGNVSTPVGVERTVLLSVRPSRDMRMRARVGGAFGDVVTAPANEWTELRHTGISTSATALQSGLILSSGGDHRPGDWIDIDEAMLVEGEYDGPYADGDSEGWYWEGMRHASTSREGDSGYYTGPYFDGSTGIVDIEGSSMSSEWDGVADDSPSRLTMSEATTSVTVERSIDDGESWEPVMEDDYAEDALSFCDFEALSCGTTIYRVTGYSENGEAAETLFEATADSEAIWLSTGEEFDIVARLPLVDAIRFNRARIRAREHYEGRTLSVAYASSNVDRQVGFSGAVPDSSIGDAESATREELDDIVIAPFPVHLYRDRHGNRVYGMVGAVAEDREWVMGSCDCDNECNGCASGLWTYSLTLDETEHQ